MNSLTLTPEQEALVMENTRLVHFFLAKIGINRRFSEYEEYYCIGIYGLIKAAKTFDTTKKIKFSSYAIACIKNQIFMRFRWVRRHDQEFSYDAPIFIGKDRDEIDLKDTLKDPKSDFLEIIEEKDQFLYVLRIILNCLTLRGKLLLLYMMCGKNQEQIASKLNISQSFVSRCIRKDINKLRNLIQHSSLIKQHEGGVVVNETNNMYKIVFSSKDVRNVNLAISEFFSVLAKESDSESLFSILPDFKLRCNKEMIAIWLPSCPESFLVLAELVKVIDNFSLSYNSSKGEFVRTDTMIEKQQEISNEQCNEEYSAEYSENATEKGRTETESHLETGESKEQKINLINKKNKAKRENHLKRKSKIGLIREYILGIETEFGISDIKIHFGDEVKEADISNALYDLKRKGVIQNICIGRYKVIK